MMIFNRRRGVNEVIHKKSLKKDQDWKREMRDGEGIRMKGRTRKREQETLNERRKEKSENLRGNKKEREEYKWGMLFKSVMQHRAKHLMLLMPTNK